MPGKRSYRKDKIKRHRSKLFYRQKQSGGGGETSEQDGTSVVGANQPVNTGTPVVGANQLGNTGTPVVGANPSLNLPVEQAITPPQTEPTSVQSENNNNNNHHSSVEQNEAKPQNNAPDMKVKDIYDLLYEATSKYEEDKENKKNIKINNEEFVNPFDEVTKVEYDLTYNPFDMNAPLNNNETDPSLEEFKKVPKVPYYSMNSFQITNVQVKYLPNHQKDFLAGLLKANKEITNPQQAYNQLRNIWIIYHHPKFRGMIIGKHIGDEDRVTKIKIEGSNGQQYFGHNNGYNSYNARVKAIAFNELPPEQKKWLNNYVMIQKQQIQNDFISALVGTPDHMTQMTQVNVQPGEGTESLIPDDKKILFLDWDPKQIAVMPLSPAQASYSFDAVPAFRGYMMEQIKTEEMEQIKNKEFTPNEDRRSSDVGHLDRNEDILKALIKKQGNASETSQSNTDVAQSNTNVAQSNINVAQQNPNQTVQPSEPSVIPENPNAAPVNNN